ncbi:MAG: glycosyltransferase [Candidatus Wallbacteria bacterium]|nr:glycosyltransferase [Candidatus Wallbacteria bacterium]
MRVVVENQVSLEPKRGIGVYTANLLAVLTTLDPRKNLALLVEAFYRGAELFAFPPAYRGFGLPLLEAMACGIPVVATRGSSRPGRPSGELAHGATATENEG